MTRRRTPSFGRAQAIVSPRDRLLPGLGARLAGHAWLAAAVFVLLRSFPGRTRRWIERNVMRPLLSRMEAELDVPVSGGFRVRVDTTQVIGRALLVTGMWEPHIAGVFQAFLEPGDVCVDAGANLGYFTLLGALLVGPRGRVYALEPAARPFRALLSNLSLNRTANVTALSFAAGAASGEAVLENDEQSVRTRVAVAPQPASRPEAFVGVRTIASIVAEDELPRVRLIKIDVEGSEADVLRGVEPILESGARPAIIVEAHNGAIEGVVDLALSLSEKYGLVVRQIQRHPARTFGGSRDELLSSLEHSYERHLLLAAAEDCARLSRWLREDES